MPGLQACALKSPEQIRALIYGWAVGTVGAGDTVAFGLPGTLLRMAGVYVPVCSQDYQTGQGIGGLVNGALALASLGGDATADASLAGEAAGAGERFVADGAATEGEGLLPSAEGDATGGAGDPGGNPSGCNCFPGNTGVATPHGLVAIAAIKVGDTVLAEDPSTHRVDAEPVQAVIDDGVKPLLRLQLSDGSGLKVTANHPFYVDGGPGIVTPRWCRPAISGWVTGCAPRMARMSPSPHCATTSASRTSIP